ncbi:riboflavin synthase [Marinithermus hydrothermalis]|uniref:Riboflavin synthase n=1 Tax=Marinithermus hydrothermalis (strain DSM 14884 / JCM 11576 / T1) TaxID=869210 RepID=F2NKC6_MARHT|nr:riboflavin synthase [Marinithermus hydrothermalis]AEB12375.1 riboflavin synthase, alpha subunit [Marinithermus hydrothermalis DSM 14884]
MFTGIVEEVGTIREATPSNGNLRLWIEAHTVTQDARIGDSIAVNGVCLTVVAREPHGFAVELARETLERTAPRWAAGRRVNLERALALGDRLGGHFVTGHVDGVGRVQARRNVPGAYDLVIQAPPELARYIARKGSIAIDGVSLTVVQVEGATFSVTLIPHTLKATTLGELQEGDAVNLEVDLIARYLERLLQPTPPAEAQP